MKGWWGGVGSKICECVQTWWTGQDFSGGKVGVFVFIVR